MPPKVTPVPYLLVTDDGEVAQGVFSSAVPDANLQLAPVRIAGRALPRWLARFRFKQWQHFACILPEAFVGVAVVDLGWMRGSWCHVRRRPAREGFEHARRSPLLDLRVAADLWQDRTWAHARGYRLEIESSLKAGDHRIWIDVQEGPGRPAVRGELRARQDLQRNQPLVVCMPIAPGRPMYSHKAVLPLEGELIVGDGGPRLWADPQTSFAVLDVHKAYYPHHTFWEWATLAGRLADGRWLGLNLTRNANQDDERLNENALWLDGAIEHLGAARFEHSPDPGAPWRVRTSDGRVDLSFTPQAGRGERLRLGPVLRSVFDQLQGTFSGAVRFGDEPIAVEGLFGLCEDHDSLW
jgi:hypothetical protein